VIGIILDKITEQFTVDIGYHQTATLNFMNFENASKRNIPNLHPGDMVYCRVVIASRDMDPELSCLSMKGKADGFGKLEGGYMFKCSTGLSRDCLAEDVMVLNQIANYKPYEISVGLNGRIWVNAGSPMDTILISNAILNSEHMSNNQIRAMVKTIFESQWKKAK